VEAALYMHQKKPPNLEWRLFVYLSVKNLDWFLELNIGKSIVTKPTAIQTRFLLVILVFNRGKCFVNPIQLQLTYSPELRRSA
jgi:hypothetical protein